MGKSKDVINPKGLKENESKPKEGTISLIEDFKIKELASVKVLLFLQSAGDMALYPFFTLHMKSLGISMTDIGIQFAVTPLATLIATPLVGLLADKIGNFRRMLSIALVICACIAYLLLYVPKINTVLECVHNGQSVRMECPKTGSVADRDRYFELTLPNCLKPITDTKSEPGNELAIGNGKYRNFKPANSMPMELITFAGCSVSCESSPGSLCLYYESDGNYCFGLDSRSSKPFRPDSLVIKLSPNSELIGNYSTPRMDATLHTVTYNGNTYLDLTCKTNGSANCYVDCPLNKPGMIPHFKQRKIPEPSSLRLTFWMYLVLRVSLIVVIATEMSLLKAAILTLVAKNNSEYGYQRLWSSMAVVFVPPLTGIVMDKLKKSGDIDAFVPCFIVYCSFKLIMAVVSFFIDLNIKPPAMELWGKLSKLLRNKEVAILLFYVTFIGSTWGFIETFIVWYLEELNASRFLIGLSFSISAISGIPFNIYAGTIERRIGHVMILIIGIMVYAIRLIGYSFAPNAFVVLAFETLEGITTTLLIVTITTYAAILSTHELLATMQAAWAALHFAVGRALGSVVGGFLFENLGAHQAYQVYALACIVAGTSYTFIYIFYLKGKESKRRSDSVKPNRSEERRVGKECQP